MRLLFLITLLTFLTSCATQQYKGLDAGYLVIATGKSTDMKCIIPTVEIYHYDDKNNYHDFKLPYVNHGFFGKDNYSYESSSELGDVRVVKLKPGPYSIGFYETLCGNSSVKNTNHLGIKFDIKPNQTTYIGNFQANLITAKFLGIFNTPKLIYFYLTDRNKEDIAIAKQQIPELPDQKAIIALPDTKNNIYIRSEKITSPKE